MMGGWMVGQYFDMDFIKIIDDDDDDMDDDEDEE